MRPLLARVPSNIMLVAVVVQLLIPLHSTCPSRGKVPSCCKLGCLEAPRPPPTSRQPRHDFQKSPSCSLSLPRPAVPTPVAKVLARSDEDAVLERSPPPPSRGARVHTEAGADREDRVHTDLQLAWSSSPPPRIDTSGGAPLMFDPLFGLLIKGSKCSDVENTTHRTSKTRQAARHSMRPPQVLSASMASMQAVQDFASVRSGISLSQVLR